MNIKTNNQPFLIAIFFISYFTFISCKKEGNDISKPSITIVEPMANDTASGELHIEFTISDDIELASTSAFVVDSTNKEIYSQTKSLNGTKVFAFHDHVDLNMIKHISQTTVNISAKDKAGNETFISIPVILKP
jgi:hypothetical protein